MKLIIDFVMFLVELIKFVFNLVISFIGVLFKCFDFLVGVIQALPTMFIVIVVGLLAITILYKVLGREGESE